MKIKNLFIAATVALASTSLSAFAETADQSVSAELAKLQSRLSKLESTGSNANGLRAISVYGVVDSNFFGVA